ncbi:MAG: RNA methyltransferase [Gemmatimonadota bacterium]
MSHSLVTTIRDLGRRRGRERRSLAVAEGVRLVEEAQAANVEIRGAVVSPALEGTSRGKSLKVALHEAGVPIAELSDRELGELADTEQPQGIIAVIAPRQWTLADIPLGPSAVVVVLDGVQDPGNVGTIARTALGLGAAGLVSLAGTVDLNNSKVLRGSMGALFRLPAPAVEDAALLDWIRAGKIALWVADAAGTPVSRMSVPDRLALVVGNEGAGARPAMVAAASERVSIPLSHGAESLNVAVATGILLHEVQRAR